MLHFFLNNLSSPVYADCLFMDVRLSTHIWHTFKGIWLSLEAPLEAIKYPYVGTYESLLSPCCNVHWLGLVYVYHREPQLIWVEYVISSTSKCYCLSLILSKFYFLQFYPYLGMIPDTKMMSYMYRLFFNQGVISIADKSALWLWREKETSKDIINADLGSQKT